MSLRKLAHWLVMLGAINWGLIGLVEFDLVSEILGSWPDAVRIVNVLIGASAVYMLAKHNS